MEALTKGLSMGFALFLFVLAFLAAQESVRKSETLLEQTDALGNNGRILWVEVSAWDE